MGDDTNAAKTQKKSWWKGLKHEFQKIVWPDRKSLMKQTTVVVTISIALGLLISVIDLIIKYGVKFLIG